MRIAILTSNYPSRSRPYCGAFVRELVWAFARQGEECTVISPTSYFEVRHGRLDPTQTTEGPAAGNLVSVLRPRHVTFSSKRLLSFNTGVLSDASFVHAASRVLARATHKPDVLYGHFFYPGGKAAMRFGLKCDIPVFVAHGDDEIDAGYVSQGRRDFEGVAGVVAVSRRNKRFCEDVYGIPSCRVRFFPNGVNHRLFFPRSRVEMRRKLGLPLDKRIVAFVGHFIERKGPHRVLQAVEGLEDVQLMLIGAGPIRLRSSRICFAGIVKHDALPEYLSAADVFALPTLQEGCCNAILEALACGLPIVSSIGEFNDDILNDDVSIRVDPLDVDAISNAIRTVLDDESLRMRMSKNCLVHAQRFSVDSRAQGMLDWMSSLVNKHPTTLPSGEGKQ